MRRNSGSFGSALWDWGKSPEGSAHSGNNFAPTAGPDLSAETARDSAEMRLKHAESEMTGMKRNGSIGSQMWQWVQSPLKSREGSAHGGSAFGGRSSHSSSIGSELWNWGSDDRQQPSRGASQHGGQMFKVPFTRTAAGSPGPDASANEALTDRQLKATAELSNMKRKGSIGSQLWAWAAGTPPQSQPSSRAGSMHGGNHFGDAAVYAQARAHAPTVPSPLGSPCSSRSNSLHGGTAFKVPLPSPPTEAAVRP